MTSLQDAILKSFIPRMAMKLDNLGRYEKDHRVVLEICAKALEQRYDTFTDSKNGTIYIGKRI